MASGAFAPERLLGFAEEMQFDADAGSVGSVGSKAMFHVKLQRRWAEGRSWCAASRAASAGTGIRKVTESRRRAS